MRSIIRILATAGVVVAILTTGIGLQNVNAAVLKPPILSLETLKIILIGDSYTAGNGIGGYYGDKDAYRSRFNWGFKYAAYLNEHSIRSTIKNLAYSGDTTDKVMSRQLENFPSDADVVMMTVGGNDANFSGVVQECFAGGLRSMEECRGHVYSALLTIPDIVKGTEEILQELEDKLDDNSVVILVAYPYISLEDDDYELGQCYAYHWLDARVCVDWRTYPAATRVRNVGHAATVAQRTLVEEWNRTHVLQVKFIDSVPDHFNGHEPDPLITNRNDRRWINEFGETNGEVNNNGITESSLSIDYNEWYHPNITGHKEISNAIIAQLKKENFKLPVKTVTTKSASSRPLRVAPAELPQQRAWVQGPYVAKVDESIEIDAMASYSVTGDIVKYEWSFDDPDLDFETTTPLFEHAFSKEYDGEMRLKITDSFGETAIASTELIVSDDGDSTPRNEDNCPDVYNYSQSDYDNDGIGDECDPTPGYPTEDLPGVFEIVNGIPSIPLLYEDGTIHHPDGSVGRLDSDDKNSTNLTNTNNNNNNNSLTLTLPISKFGAASNNPFLAVVDDEDNETPINNNVFDSNSTETTPAKSAETETATKNNELSKSDIPIIAIVVVAVVVISAVACWRIFAKR